jgi:hypothetical protein
MSHAVARLRAERLLRCRRPVRARGSRAERCPHCRVPSAHCLCALRPRVPTRAGMCLLMHDVEPLKPTNTGWLVADVVPETSAFTWSRTEPDPRLLARLEDPRWQPYVVFPGGYADARRVVREVHPAGGRLPLFVLLDATWREARRMFRRSPWLDQYSVLDCRPARPSRYRLRQARRDGHLCTAEVAALCLQLAGDDRAARALDAWLDLFIARYLQAKRHGAPTVTDEAHERLRAFLQEPAGSTP